MRHPYLSMQCSCLCGMTALRQLMGATCFLLRSIGTLKAAKIFRTNSEPLVPVCRRLWHRLPGLRRTAGGPAAEGR